MRKLSAINKVSNLGKKNSASGSLKRLEDLIELLPIN